MLLDDSGAIQQRYERLLNPEGRKNIGFPIPLLTEPVARKIKERCQSVKLYLHSFSVVQNFDYGTLDVHDMMGLAVAEGLEGIKIHVEEGDERCSLSSMCDQKLQDVADLAAENNLDLHLETSSTSKDTLEDIVRIARRVGAEHLRVYSRPDKSMRLSELKQLVISDLRRAAVLAETHDLHFTLEPHEVLKSHEVVEIIEAVDSKRVNVLFDFSNMVNANEKPLEALQTMAPYITQVHAKDSRVIRSGNGKRQVGVVSGTGDLNQIKLLHDLVLLGEDTAQVKVIGLEEHVGFASPAYRFSDEAADPVIPIRDKSLTEVLPDPAKLADALAAEFVDTQNQLTTFNDMLQTLSDIATEALEEPSVSDTVH